MVFVFGRFAQKYRRYFSLSLAVHVSPEGRSSEVAGARLAWRDKYLENLFENILFRKSLKNRKERKFRTIMSRAMLNGSKNLQ